MFQSGVVLDLVVLIFLGLTLFYAIRLSVYLRDFREGKEDMERLVNTLSQNIVKSQSVISEMGETAKSSGGRLQEFVKEARVLADELRFMNEAGDNLASRLEGLLAEARESIKGGMVTVADITADGSSVDRMHGSGFPSDVMVEQDSGAELGRSFDDDTDYLFSSPEPGGNAEGVGDIAAEGGEFPDGDDEAEDELYSRAEKELYDALMEDKKLSGGVM